MSSLTSTFYTSLFTPFIVMLTGSLTTRCLSYSLSMPIWVTGSLLHTDLLQNLGNSPGQLGCLIAPAGGENEANPTGIKASTWKGPMSPPLTSKASHLVIPTLTGVGEATSHVPRRAGMWWTALMTIFLPSECVTDMQGSRHSAEFESICIKQCVLPLSKMRV